MNGGDPLRTGKIFGLDPNLLKRMRPQPVPASKPQPQPPPNPLESFTREELIPGLKAKFDDVFRRTPNPMNALFGSPQSYLPAHLSNTHSSSSYSSPTLLSAPQTPQSTYQLDRQPLTPMACIEEDTGSPEPPPVISGKPPLDAPPEKPPPPSPASLPKPSLSPLPKRLPNPPKETPKTEEKKPRGLHPTAGEARQTKSEGKKPRPRTRPQGTCDSLSLLFAPSSSHAKRGDTHTLHSSKTAAFPSSRPSRPTSPTEQARSKKSKPTVSPEAFSVQQRLFSSPTKRSLQPSPPSATPDKISKRTRSRTQNTQQRSILSQLPEAAVPVATADLAPPVTSRSQNDARSEREPIAQKKSSKGTGKSHSQEGRPRKAPAKAKQTSSSSQSRSKKRKQSLSDAESDGQGEGGGVWRKEEIVALRQAHRQCPVDAPNFWELVALKLNEGLRGGYSRRSPEECHDQWYQALSIRNDRKKRKAAPDPQRNSSEDAPPQKPKRRTQAQLRSMLEEAFVGEADDLFESRSLSHSSLTSTPHRDPLLAPALHSILAVKSPLDLQPRPHDKRPSEDFTERSPSAAGAPHWEASYVNKMKKQQRSNRLAVAPAGGGRGGGGGKSKGLATAKSSKKASSEFTGRRVEASMNGHGRVTISVRHRDDDDSENEEQLRELVASSHRQSASSGYDESEGSDGEEQEWQG